MSFCKKPVSFCRTFKVSLPEDLVGEAQENTKSAKQRRVAGQRRTNIRTTEGRPQQRKKGSICTEVAKDGWSNVNRGGA